jgi:hypothetical protein
MNYGNTQIGYNSVVTNSTFFNNTVGISIIGDGNNISYNRIEQSEQYGIFIGGSNNIIYNNLLNNTVNVYFSATNINNWNTTRQAGTRIYTKYYGNEIGGNYWTNPNGTGYSDTCADSNWDGFCDEPYTLASNNVDYLPLSIGVSQEDLVALRNCMLNKERLFSQYSRGWVYKLRNNLNMNWYCFVTNPYSNLTCEDRYDSWNCSQMSVSSDLPRPLSIGERWEFVLPPSAFYYSYYAKYYYAVVLCYNSTNPIKDNLVYEVTVPISYGLELLSCPDYRCADNLTLAYCNSTYTYFPTKQECDFFDSQCCYGSWYTYDCSPSYCMNGECVCSCTDWTAGSCYNSTHRTYTRTCNPSGCDVEIKYEEDPSCGMPWLSLLTILLSPFWIVLLMAFGMSAKVESKLQTGGIAFLAALIIFLFVFAFYTKTIPLWIPIIFLIIAFGYIIIRGRI